MQLCILSGLVKMNNAARLPHSPVMPARMAQNARGPNEARAELDSRGQQRAENFFLLLASSAVDRWHFTLVAIRRNQLSRSRSREIREKTRKMRRIGAKSLSEQRSMGSELPACLGSLYVYGGRSKELSIII
jgi:hypothetical protein